ncbi:hypothetical protein EQG49_12645 [Periweissella cryptocerci]|uniref:Uncharacterized protein n=1 Tax=Periweissella cryptocerci TaxID=2506420 RepID=A0A4P6YWR7_9LACO|nr:hypothetical protein [Periweissella cryptocerci]QBO37246.1 hypothetical protein EQG49_12645 [Periweissella cryptocerci]
MDFELPDTQSESIVKALREELIILSASNENVSLLDETGTPLKNISSFANSFVQLIYADDSTRIIHVSKLDVSFRTNLE